MNEPKLIEFSLDQLSYYTLKLKENNLKIVQNKTFFILFFISLILGIITILYISLYSSLYSKLFLAEDDQSGMSQLPKLIIYVLTFGLSFGALLSVPFCFLSEFIFEKYICIKYKNVHDYDIALNNYHIFIKQQEEVRKKIEEQKHLNYWISLNGYEFEREIMYILKRINYDVTLTKGSGDGGVDLIIFDEKNNKKTIVQCKNHNKPIGPGPLRELYGVLDDFSSDQGILICPKGFTNGAIDFAKNKSLLLWDINDILKIASGQTPQNFA